MVEEKSKSPSASELVEKVSEKFVKSDIPDFAAGDTVRVHCRIIEGNKERVQVFEGVVLRRSRGARNNATFTVRKISAGVGVERTFLVHSPRIEKIEVVGSGVVRRAKLYYLRDLSGKAARLKKRSSDEGQQNQSNGSGTVQKSASADVAVESASA